jgi:hypothetical protein
VDENGSLPTRRHVEPLGESVIGRRREGEPRVVRKKTLLTTLSEFITASLFTYWLTLSEKLTGRQANRLGDS